VEGIAEADLGAVKKESTESEEERCMGRFGEMVWFMNGPSEEVKGSEAVSKDSGRV
jgi:hypothetical protein